MAEPMFGPKYKADQQGIDRRRKIAEMLMKQALQPQQGQMAGRIYVPPSPLSAVARVAQGYFGGKGMSKADEEEKALGERHQGDLAKEVERIAAMRQGQPPTMDAADNVEQPGVQADPRAAITAALTSQYPAVQKMGALEFQEGMRSSEAAAAQAARLEQKALELDQRAEDKSLDRASREQMAKEANALRLEIAKLTKAAGGRSPYFQFFPTTKGIAAGNSRTGTAALVPIDGAPAVRPADDPTLQGSIAGAKATGTAEAKRTFNMSGIGATIDRAEKVLEGKNPDTGAEQSLPTGSGMGSLVDKAAGFFGFSPSGATEATDLKAIGGALTSKMPRMEGPQSDRDTQLYRESAAQIGDSTVPVEQRRRALDTVKALWRKYENQNPDAFEGTKSAPNGLSPAEQAELESLRKRLGR